MNQQIDSFSKTINDIKYQSEANQEEFKSLLKYKEIMYENVNQVTENFRNMTTNIEQIVSKLNERLNQLEINQQIEQEKSSNENKFNQNLVRDVQQQQNFLAENFQANLQQQRELVQAQGSQKSSIEILEEQMKNVSNNLQQTKKIAHKFDDLQKYIKELETYMQIYSPLYIQGQISETLYNVLNHFQIKKLIDYEETLFQQMSQKILSGGDKELKKSKGEAQNYIEDIIKKNRNFSISQKYSNSSEIEASTAVIQPVKKVNTKESEEYIELIEKIQKDIKNQLLSQRKLQDQKFEKLTNLVNEMDQSTQQQFFIIKNNLDDQKTQITNFNQLLQIQIGYHENQKRNVWMEMDKLVLNLNSISENVNKILQFSVLVNQLMIQEEIDKNQMSLYGSKDEGQSSKYQICSYLNLNDDKKMKQNFSLDINCVSCSGQTEVLNKLFKIACLAYHPSLIQVDGKMYRRDEIIEMNTKILQSAKQEYNPPKNQSVKMESLDKSQKPSLVPTKPVNFFSSTNVDKQDMHKSQQGKFHQQNQMLPNLPSKPIRKTLHRKDRISTQIDKINNKQLFLNASII